MTTSMYFSTQEELFIFGCACLLGVFFGAVYELLRVVRCVVPHKKIMTFSEDFLYMVFCCFWFFIFSMELVRGSLRGFVVIGCVGGFFAFHFTAGNVVLFIVKKVVGFLKKYVFCPLWNATGSKILIVFREKSTKFRARFVQNCKKLKNPKKSRKTT